MSETLFELIPMLPLIFQRHFYKVFELIPMLPLISRDTSWKFIFAPETMSETQTDKLFS